MTVSVARGRIETWPSEAIVNAANSSLAEGAGVCGAVFGAVKRVGVQNHRDLTDACRKHGPCPTGEARITPSFGLPASHIIHAVGPRWSGEMHEISSPATTNELDDLGLLVSTYRSILDLCRVHRISSVAIPAISTGIFGVPKEHGAAIARTVCERESGPIAVTLVAYDEESLATLQAAIAPAVAADLVRIGL